ncbi:MAG: 6-bladed beta-propeller [Cytophagales bacterium]|nr:6-bladed beta-propeller [Cytophagales bacterium]
MKKVDVTKIGIAFMILLIVLVQTVCTFNRSAETDKEAKVTNDRTNAEILRLPEIEEDTLRTSYFADTVLYVPLETTTKNLIKYFKQVWMDDSIILINNHNNLLMFLRGGKFLRQIGRKGKGPGEYGRIFRFDVISDTIYLSSTGKRSIIKYTFDGTFCEEIQLNEQPVYFSSTNDGKMAWYHIQQGKIYIHNKDFSMADTIVIEQGVTEGRSKYTYGDYFFMTYFQKSQSGLLFSNYLNDTVWDISSKRKEPAFVVDMNDKLLPLDKQIEFSGGDFDKWEKTAKRYQMVHLIPFSRAMLIFEKHWCTENYSAIYLQNRLTREIKKFSTSYIYEDMVGWQKLSNFTFTNSTDFLVAVTYPHELKENPVLNNGNAKMKAPPIWLNQMKTIGENDNPILVLIKVKEDL